MPLKIKNLKSIDFSCSSPSSTAICSSTNHHFMVKNSTKSFTNNNKYNNNSLFSSRAPCISELPFNPRLSSSYREKPRKKPSILKQSDLTPRRKSSADAIDYRRFHEKCSYNPTLSPSRTHSSRYLLGESKFLDSISESTHHQNLTNNRKNAKNNDAWALIPSTPIVEVHETKRFDTEIKSNKSSLELVNYGDQRVIKSTNEITKYDYENNQKDKSLDYYRNDSVVLKKSSSTGNNRSRDQVVILRVSLHCKGCAGKLKKHLSKMEGVTSYSIDLETKKVTVKGNVTPLSVLASISKVKNAQFWPSSSSASPSSSSSSSSSSTSNNSIDYLPTH
ncbi:unnamed protein product [Amaranthus hypochondriacus]